MARPPYAYRHQVNSGNMSETYTECTKFGDVQISSDGVSPFETIKGQIGEIKIGTRVRLYTLNKCIGTVKWMGRPRGVRFGGFLLGVKLDNEASAPIHDRTFGEYCDQQLIHTSRQDVIFRGIKSWEVIREDRQPEYVGMEVEKKPFYKRHTPSSKFNQILVPVNGLEEGSRVKLSSGTTGTVRWIGCYHKKEVQPKDYIVGVELDSTLKEYTSLLTNGRLEGEWLVRSSRYNIKFVKLKELILITVPLKSRQHESPQNTDSKSGGASHHSKPGSAVRVSQTTPLNPMTGRDLPPTPGQEKNKQEFLMINNQVAPVSEQRVVINGHSVNRSYKHADIVTSNEPVKSPGTSQSSPRPSPPPRAHRQASRQASREQEPMDTSDSPSLQPKPQQLSPKIVPRTLAENSKPEINSIPFIDNVPESRFIHDMEKKLQSAVINQVSGNEISRKGSTDMAHEEPVRPVLDSQGAHAEAYAGRVHRHPENDERGQRLRQPIHDSQGARPKVYTNMVHKHPVEEKRVPLVSQPSSDNHHHGEVYYSAQMELEWEKDQFDAGIVLRGEVEKQKDHTYFTTIVPLDKSEKDLIDSVGAPLDDIVGGYVLPPTHEGQYPGRWKGVQGDQNSCYMDASIFAMFSYLTVFDNTLFDPEMLDKHSKSEDRERAKNIRSTLLRKIVNPLRKYGLVQKQGMHELRKQLDEWGLVRGMTGDEKDPEEFLNLLLVHTFCTPPPICLSNGQESHLFHLLADKEEGMPFPTVQELVERTCLQEAFKFTKIPPYLILHLPRWGKDFKMYDNVMPSLELDITGVLCGTRQTCYVCGEEARYECYGCYKDTHKISEACFCDTCGKKYHSNVQRSSHKLQRLPSVSDDGGETPKCVLNLAAVLSIETSHYVTFVASDTTPYAQWYFFDSMADRQGTTNIPEVTELKEFRSNLKLAKESVTSVSPQMRRLVKDGYICFYSNPDIPQYHYARPESSVDQFHNYKANHY